MRDPHTVLRSNREQAFQESNDALERQMQEKTVALRESEAAARDSEAWLTAQKEAFQAAINGVPLEDSLSVLIPHGPHAVGHR